MGVTHFSSLYSTGTLQASGNVVATASGKTLSVTKLAVTGTVTLSGAVTATKAAAQSSLTKLAVTGTAVVSGNVQATGTGKRLTIQDLRMVSGGTGGLCGLKSVGTAGTGVVLASRVRSSSRIQVTPIGIAQRGLSAWVSTISSGTNFTVKLTRTQTSGTVVGHTGRVAWFIVNK